MSDDKKPAGGAEGSSVGDTSADQNKPDPKPKSVAWEDHKRAVDDMHRFKKEAQEAKERLAKAEEERLRANEDWKTLAEREKKRADEAETKNKNFNDVLVRTQKYNEIRKVAVEMGLRSEALDDLDLVDVDGVQVEATTSGRFIVHGARQFVEELKAKKSHWFKKDSAPPVNGGSGASGLGKAKPITANDLYVAERNMKAGLISREKYTDLYNKYLSQKPN